MESEGAANHDSPGRFFQPDKVPARADRSSLPKSGRSALAFVIAPLCQQDTAASKRGYILNFIGLAVSQILIYAPSGAHSSSASSYYAITPNHKSVRRTSLFRHLNLELVFLVIPFRGKGCGFVCVVPNML
jgi:hypothetical protein